LGGEGLGGAVNRSERETRNRESNDIGEESRFQENRTRDLRE